MKKNLKGFTLVELIVVMALMGIIMAGVFAILSPTSRMAARITSAKDEETAAFQAGRSVSNVLSYATNAIVYGVNAGGTVPNPSSDMYTYVYIIDNVNARATSSKGAKGVINRAAYTSSGIGTQKCVIPEDIFGEDHFKIIISEYGAGGESNYITLEFEGMPMKADGTSYVPNTDQKYSYKVAIDFLNINNKGQLNGGAAYSLQVDSSVDEPCDYYYIFFKPATDTVLKESSSSESGSSSSESSSESSAEADEEEEKVIAQFDYQNGSTPIQKYIGSTYEVVTYAPAINDPTQYDQTVETYLVGWQTPTGTPIDQLVFSNLGDTNVFIPQKANKTKVEFKDFSGNVIATRWVVPGQKPDLPDSLPVPTDDTKLFDYYKNSSTNTKYDVDTIGTTAVVYVPVSKDKPTDEEAAKEITVNVHFLSSFRGRVAVRINDDKTFNITSDAKNGTVTGEYTRNDTTIYRGTSEVWKFPNNGNWLSAEFQEYNEQNNGTKVSFSNGELQNGKTYDYYVYYDSTGSLKGQFAPEPNVVKTPITIHFSTDPANDLVISPSGYRTRVEFDIAGDSTRYFSNKIYNSDYSVSKSVKQGVDTQISALSDLKLTIGTASITITNDGVAKEYWYCATPKGTAFLTEELGKYSWVTIYFLDDIPNEKGMNIWSGSGSDGKIWIKGSGSATAITKEDQFFGFGENGTKAGKTVKFAVFGQTGLGNGMVNTASYKSIFCAPNDDVTYYYSDDKGFYPVDGSEVLPAGGDLSVESIQVDGTDWGRVDYKITLKNNTSSLIDNLEFSFAIPEGLNVSACSTNDWQVSGKVENGKCIFFTNVGSYGHANLAAGKTVTYTLYLNDYSSGINPSSSVSGYAVDSNDVVTSIKG